MKKIWIFALLLSTSFALPAQNWLQNDHQWTFHLSGGFAGFNVFYKQKIASDTIVAGQNCKKVIVENMPFTPPPRFAYEQNNAVFAYNTLTESWAKIYDFNLPVNSVVTVPTIWGSSFSYRIESIDLVQAGDLSLKRQRVTEIPTDTLAPGLKFDILERIGAVGLPLDLDHPECSYFFVDEAPFCQSFVDGFDVRFICFASSAGSFAPYSGCTSTSATHSPQTLAAITISPNPATDYMQVQTTGHDLIHTMQVVDMQGRTLINMAGLNSVSVELAVGDLPAGRYTVVAQTQEGYGVYPVVLSGRQ